MVFSPLLFFSSKMGLSQLSPMIIPHSYPQLHIQEGATFTLSVETHAQSHKQSMVFNFMLFCLDSQWSCRFQKPSKTPVWENPRLARLRSGRTPSKRTTSLYFLGVHAKNANYLISWYMMVNFLVVPVLKRGAASSASSSASDFDARNPLGWLATACAP